MAELVFHDRLLFTLNPYSVSSSFSSCKVMPMSLSRFTHNPLSVSGRFSLGRLYRPPLVHQFRFRPSPLLSKKKDSDMISQLELGKLGEKKQPEKQANGIFWILLLNIGLYVADHIFQLIFQPDPVGCNLRCSTNAVLELVFIHRNQELKLMQWWSNLVDNFKFSFRNHLSSNLFFVYIFGKLVEEEEGNVGLWFSYILTGVGANLVSWLLLPRNAVSVGASGAVYGLFAISVLVKVMEAAQASTNMSVSSQAVLNVNHIAHLSGALVGATLVWLLSRVPSRPLDQDK